ncbi:MAG: fatty acid desaturase [Verrucomicrobia bacterium]|nr:fatty acid desaturase [Verrucomicrobiota bacterium]
MKNSKYDWGVLIFIVGYHLALLIGLPIYFMNHSPSAGICVVSALLMYISGISVTAGYHRLYSHSTYKTNKYVEAVLLFFATIATQGSALKWACDHRKHHAYVDRDQDPYSIKKGFLFAHILWMFYKADPIDPKVVADLYKNKLVMFQHKFYVPLMFLTNILSFVVMGYIFNDYLSAFVFVWGVRLLVLHHFTWFINSLAHTWGSKSFSQEHSAVDNYLMSIFTFGEGYHNYHHTFANDYRNGIRWYHFDPTKWLIWTLSKFKLAYGLRKVSHIRIQERIVIERRNEMIEVVKNYLSVNSAILEEKIESTTRDILARFSDFYRLTQEYKSYKEKGQPNKDLLEELKLQIESLKKGIAEDWEAWNKLSKDIMKQAAAS